jgi:hypothetical protein
LKYLLKIGDNIGQKEKTWNRKSHRLASFDKEKKVQVIIETPKGSRNKYAWDQDQQIFELKKVLPEAVCYETLGGGKK